MGGGRRGLQLVPILDREGAKTERRASAPSPLAIHAVALLSPQLMPTQGDRSRRQATDTRGAAEPEQAWRDQMNINRVVLTGNLTADPELRPTPSGTSVARLRLAVNTRRPNSSTGTWGGEAQLLRRHRLGSAGRGLRPVSVQGPDGRSRRSARVARVRGQRRDQTPGSGDHRRDRSLPRPSVRCAPEPPALA